MKVVLLTTPYPRDERLGAKDARSWQTVVDAHLESFEAALA